MSRTYKATGINLKSMPLGEADRLVTILTPEYGLIRAVAAGARKHNSRLRGRSELFVVNELLLAKGRSLDKITQAETLISYPGLSRDLGKLAASQYLAEVILYLGLSDQPQTELYDLLNEHLRRLEQLPTPTHLRSSAPLLLAHLAHAVFHLLAIAGVAPQVHICCVTEQPVKADLANLQWRAGFSLEAGGIITRPRCGAASPSRDGTSSQEEQNSIVAQSSPKIDTWLGATEVVMLQHLSANSLAQVEQILPKTTPPAQMTASWIGVERLLRNCAQHYFGRSIRSATLVDTLFAPCLGNPD